jgi:Domain of unknown function (DUF4055)
MPVTTLHGSYNFAADGWLSISDAWSGQRTVKSKTTRYLPALSGSDPTGANYASYLRRAVFPPFFALTVNSLMGLIFKKAVTLEDAGPAESYLSDAIDSEGGGVGGLARRTFSDVLAFGRHGVLLDMAPIESPDPIAPALSAAPLPYAVHYHPWQILNWREELRGGRKELAQVVLYAERQRPDPLDEFSSVTTAEYRVGELRNGMYRQRIFTAPLESRSNGQRMLTAEPREQGPPIVPLRQGVPLPFVPFWFFNPSSLDASIEPSPLEGVAAASYSYYLASSDLENGRHWSGHPTVVIADDSTHADTAPISVGGSAAITIGTGGNAFMLESAGQFASLEHSLEEKTALAAGYGYRLLETGPAGVEAAETWRIRQGGQSASLALMADVVADGLTALLQTAAWWMGATPAQARQLRCGLNTDFSVISMTPQEMLQLFELLLRGGLTPNAFVWNLQQGERLPPNTDPTELENQVAAVTTRMRAQQAALPQPSQPVIEA